MVRSAAWEYFEKKTVNGKSQVLCTVCKVFQPFKGNTTNLFSHLKYHHKSIYQEISSKIQPKPKKRVGQNRPAVGLLQNNEDLSEFDDQSQDDNIEVDVTAGPSSN